jgi:hypothetical protein
MGQTVAPPDPTLHLLSLHVLALRAIHRRLLQGQTEPILAETDDATLYVVKSTRSSVDTVVCEFLAAHFAADLGLPIPPFTLVEVRPSDAPSFAFEEARYLAREPGFASKFLHRHIQLPQSRCDQVPEDLQAQVLLFDLWIANRDRSDDNSNLLYDPTTKSVSIIDHNLAFGEPEPSLLAAHIFRKSHQSWDAAFVQQHRPRLLTSALKLKSIWDRLPDSWVERTTLSLSRVQSLLNRATLDSFWTQA